MTELFPSGRRPAPGSVGCVETVIVGARGSRLAQAMVQELITHLNGCPVVQFKAKSVMTDGDKDRKTPLRNLGGEGGVYTTPLEQELLAGNVDIAVHSLKDLPTAPSDRLVLAVTPPRADPRDALCGAALKELRPGARVGTGSARRIAQLKALRPDVEVVPIRGNVPPRLAKLKTSGLDAVILAASGLRRLGLDDAITELLDPALFPPSPGQGALAVQVRAVDRELLEMLNAFGDPDSDAAVRSERVLLGELHGGCSIPVGAYAARAGGVLTLSAQVTSLDGQQRVTGTVSGTSPEDMGTGLAGVLRDRGADAILNQIREPAAR